MNVPSRPVPSRISPGSIVLFGVCALVVGALGSARLWSALVGGSPLGFGRMLSVLAVAELLAYFAVMLAGMGAAVSGGRVLMGVGLGIALRIAQAVLAALIGSPGEAEGFGAAFRHYYAEYYTGALLQIVVTALFLWLVRSAFEPPPRVLLPPKSDVPEMEPERLKGFQEATPKRREQLIAALKRPQESPPAASESPPPLPQAPPEPGPELPAQASAEGPPALTPQQSVILALREDTVEDTVRATESVRPEPSPLGLTAVAAAVDAVTSSVGAGSAAVSKSPGGRVTFVAAGGPANMSAVLAASDRLFEASAAIATLAEVGDFQRVFMRHAQGCVGCSAVTRKLNGFAAIIALPSPANLGVANVALTRLEDATPDQSLPLWPTSSAPDMPPAYPDADLQGRLAPLLEWVPEMAEVRWLAASVAGRQVLMLSRGTDPSPAAAAAMAHGYACGQELCLALERPACDLAVWSGSAGSVACAETEVANQRLLVALLHSGPGGPGPVNVHLGQIISSLRAVSTGTAPGG